MEENLVLSDIDVREVNQNDDGTIEVLVEPTAFAAAKDVLKDMGISEFTMAEITFLPNEPITLTDSEDLRKYNELCDLLDDCEDVQNVYTNVEN